MKRADADRSPAQAQSILPNLDVTAERLHVDARIAAADRRASRLEPAVRLRQASNPAGTLEISVNLHTALAP